MPDFSKGKIYKLVSNKCLPYYGSTTDTLEYRFRKHRNRYDSWKNGKSTYTCSFEILKYDDARIELIESYPCNSREELEKREGTYILIGKNCVNKQKAGRNGDYREYQKKWYQNPENKKRQAEYQKAPHRKAQKSRKVKCECGKIISWGKMRRHIEESGQHRLWLQDPEKHKKEMARLKKEKEDKPPYKCECGAEITDQTSVINKT